MAVRFKAVFDDGSFIMGDHTLGCKLREAVGTRHLVVTSASNEVPVGMEVIIPILKPKYWIIGKIKR